MSAFITILIYVILPVFILIGIGLIMQRKFHLDLQTLSKLNLYLFVPGIIFVKMYETHFSGKVFLKILLFFAILMVCLFFISALINRLLRHTKDKGTAFTNTIIFYNSGNYGLPVNDLVFKSDPFAFSVQIIVLAFQNVLTFSYGIIALQSMNGFRWRIFLEYFKSPVFFAITIGFICNFLNIPIPSFIMTPAHYIAGGLIAVALITLGAQVAHLQLKMINPAISFSLLTRLIISPAIAFAIVAVLHLHGILAQALIISSAMPTSVNSAIIAQEYRNHPEFAAQIVWMSTLLSSVTVSLVIYLARLYS